MHTGPGVPDLCSPLDGNLVIAIKIQLGKGDTQVGILVLINAPLWNGWLASEQGEVGSRGVGVLPLRIRDTGCLSEEVTVAFTLLSENRADMDPERC